MNRMWHRADEIIAPGQGLKWIGSWEPDMDHVAQMNEPICRYCQRFFWQTADAYRLTCFWAQMCSSATVSVRWTQECTSCVPGPRSNRVMPASFVFIPNASEVSQARIDLQHHLPKTLITLMLGFIAEKEEKHSSAPEAECSRPGHCEQERREQGAREWQELGGNGSKFF